jgi:hypothetical protein
VVVEGGHAVYLDGYVWSVCDISRPRAPRPCELVLSEKARSGGSTMERCSAEVAMMTKYERLGSADVEDELGS